MSEKTQTAALLQRAHAALRLVEFGSCDGCGDGRFCLWCSQQDEFDYETVHLSNCPVASVLADLAEGESAS